MALTVYWTDFAIEQLEIIFDFYNTKVSLTVAQRIINSIINKTVILEVHPTIGQLEELLIKRKNQYRYLIDGNYKIIYWVEDSFIKIATVFDCRQNPKKLRKIK
jgi:toxin ParE1/3/4